MAARHGDIDQEAALYDIRDPAIQPSKFAEPCDDALARRAEHRGGDQHLERRNAGGSARKLAPVSLHVASVRKAVAPARAEVDCGPFHESVEGHGTLG